MFADLALGLLLAGSATAGSLVSKRSALTDCFDKAKVPYVTSGSAEWNFVVKPSNLRIAPTPVGVVTPSKASEVAAAVSCAAAAGLKVNPKSGGHGYASHQLGGESGHVVIDLRRFNTTKVDTATGIAVIGPGARLGNVATSLYSQGKRALSHGTCPGVGAGGLTLHGGYGYSSFTKGLTLDALVSAEVVIANGSIVTASATSYPDLFWALRGAGSSFGVVTEFKFQTHPAPDANVIFNLDAPWTQSQAKDAIKALQDWAVNTQPTEMNMRLLINSYSCSLGGVYYGTMANFNTATSSIFSKIGVSANTKSRIFGGGAGVPAVKGWIDSLNANAFGQMSSNFNYETHEAFFSKSLMVGELNTAAVSALVDYWFSTAKTVSRSWYLILDMHGGKNSAITKVPQNETSYGHRDKIWKMEFYDGAGQGPYPADGLNFLNGWVDKISAAQGQGQLGMYYNYADPTLSAANAHKAYWGSNYDQLVAVKNIYDPKKVFMNPQAVGA